VIDSAHFRARSNPLSDGTDECRISTCDWSSALNGPGRARRAQADGPPFRASGIWVRPRSSAVRTATGHGVPLHRKRRDAQARPVWRHAAVGSRAAEGVVMTATTIQSVVKCVQDKIFGGKFWVQCRIVRGNARFVVGSCREPAPPAVVPPATNTRVPSTPVRYPSSIKVFLPAGDQQFLPLRQER
jgi:hypothetical protein